MIDFDELNEIIQSKLPDDAVYLSIYSVSCGDGEPGKTMLIQAGAKKVDVSIETLYRLALVATRQLAEVIGASPEESAKDLMEEEVLPSNLAGREACPDA